MMAHNDNSEVILRAEKISMIYPGTVALNEVDYRVYRGKVNVIIGENGAGKSTLMKILAGVQTPSSGEIFLNDEPVSFKNTRDAASKGIGMVHQELNLFGNLSVAENIFLGREKQQGLMPLDMAEQHRVTAELMARLDQDIAPTELLSNLKVGQQQLIEIAKALSDRADVLILDEPTSALSKTEVALLFKVIRDLTAQGVSIIYISHRLEELMAIGDHITILRDGNLQSEAEVKDIDVPWIVREMLGNDPVSNFLKPGRQFGEPVLDVNNVTLLNDVGLTLVDQVSMDVKSGEIVGVYGLMGAGRTELMECLLGLQEYTGEVTIAGHAVPAKMNTSERIRLGICLVPEDRKKNGIFPVSSVSNNMTISSLWRRLKHRFTIDEKAEQLAVASAIGDLSIKVSSPEIEIRALSGGNQQKVVIGRTLLTSPKVLLLDEPTRGIDIGAKGDVFEMMVKLSEQGIGGLFSTSDLKEIMAVSDRILVMSGGKLTANIARSEATESALVSASAQGL
ncbi:sugar ABC transporter ATP-binding protein [Marinomonas arenicola]|uniref:Sugar ABC transporter ATP-binding protein n=1 Tax=Marinomonas arenicola TaxID=569601 RepID=A0ABU9G5B9_9GAMM